MTAVTCTYDSCHTRKLSLSCHLHVPGHFLLWRKILIITSRLIRIIFVHFIHVGPPVRIALTPTKKEISMKTFVFKSSLVMLTVLMLVAFFGGAPMDAAAATVMLAWSPTTSSGSFDYGTLNAGQTQSQQFTLTNTDGKPSGALTASLSGSAAFSITSDGCTGLSLGKGKTCLVTVKYAPTSSGQSDTAILSASNRKTGSASITLTGASSTPCVLQPVISPASGDVVARTYTIVASDANHCSAPLHYYCQCASGVNQQACADFLAQANANDNTTSSALLTIGENEDFTIQLNICEINNPQNIMVFRFNLDRFCSRPFVQNTRNTKRDSWS
jgi:centrosomal CEP192-like protein